MKNVIKYIVAFIFLAGILAIIFYQPIFKNFGALQWDAKEVHLYNLIFSSSVWHNQHILPLWNPYIFNGFAQIADPQVAIFYPINFLIGLFTVFSPAILIWQIIFHYFLAGLFAFLLVRYLTKDFLIGIFGGAAYMLAGFLVGHASHVGMQNTAAWLPLLVLLLLLIFQKQKIFYGASFGLILAFAFLAGHFQTFLYSVFFLALLAAYLLFRERSNLNLKILLTFAGGGLIFLLVIAVQFLPTFQLTGESSRAQISLELSQSESLNPQSLRAFLEPNFNNVAWGDYVGPWDRTQNYLYAGLATIFFAGIGFFSLKREKLTPFLIFALALAVCYSLGKYFFVQPIFYKFIPLFNKIRAPGNMMLIAQFSLIILAALGLKFLKTKLRKSFFLVVVIAAVLALSIEFVLPVSKNILLYARQMPDTAVVPPPLILQISSQYENLDRNQYFNVFRLADIGVARNFAQIFGIYSSDGYNPLLPARQEKYEDAMVKNPALIDLAGIKYLPCQYISLRSGLQKLGPLCVNQDYFPVAFFAKNYVLAQNEKEALDLTNHIDISKEVVLEKAPPGFNESEPSSDIENIEILESWPGFWKIKIENSDGGLLFLRQDYYPGWQAQINGQDAEIYRADYLFSAVPVMAGENIITLKFKPRVFYLGAGLTLAGILIFLLLVAIVIFKRRLI